MTKQKIIAAASTALPAFKNVLTDEQYQLRGIFNSEALLLVALAQVLETPTIVESGRARGHSTKLIAKFFKNDPVKIISIDFDETSPDTAYSEKYLAQYENVKLIYGDSHKLIAEQIQDNTFVFIDGPKGDEAILLAARLLKDSRVRAVAVHDLHKNTWHRNICEAIFSNHFFSDDLEFVEAFKSIDDNCWEILEGTGEAPYQRYGKKVASYASTVGVFFNSDQPLVKTAYDNYRSYYESQKPTLKSAVINSLSHDSFVYKAIKKIHNLFT